MKTKQGADIYAAAILTREVIPYILRVHTKRIVTTSSRTENRMWDPRTPGTEAGRE